MPTCVYECSDGIELEVYYDDRSRLRTRVRLFCNCTRVAEEHRPPRDADPIILRSVIKQGETGRTAIRAVVCWSSAPMADGHRRPVAKVFANGRHVEGRWVDFASQYLPFSEREPWVTIPHARMDAIRQIPASHLELSVRSQNCLESVGVQTVGDLLELSEADLLAIRSFLRISLSEVVGKLRRLVEEAEGGDETV